MSLLGALALAPASALAQAPIRFRGIKVNVEALRTNYGEDTANWVAEALPPALARALGPHLQPGDRSAPILVARIDYVYLGPSSGGGPFGASQDTITGSLIVEGGRGYGEEVPLRAISSYFPSPVDQPLWVQANHDRVRILAESFAAWAPRQLGLS
jgi:hypothetical protein